MLAFTGANRDGIIKVKTTQDGQTYQDVLEVGKHELNVTAKRDGAVIRVHVSNPNNQAIDGELYLITPLESWGGVVGEFALPSTVQPRVMGFSAPGRGEQDYEFTLTAPGDGGEPDISWAVVKCAYNGKIIYEQVVSE